MIAFDGQDTRGIKRRIGMAKTAFSKKYFLGHSPLTHQENMSPPSTVSELDIDLRIRF